MNYFKLGKLIAVHGLQGEILLKHELGRKSDFKGMQAIFIEEKKSAFIPWFIEKAKVKSDSETLLKFEGVDTREKAQTLAGKEAWLPEQEFRSLASKSAPANLVDYTIVDGKNMLGTVLEVIVQPHQVICRIEMEGKEVLVPLNDSTLKKIDHGKRSIMVELPEGLLDIYLG